MPKHLVLIGLPGAGKSTAGRLLAERLGTHCTDVDPMIERATGMTVAELFAEEGEPAFRDRERRAVLQAIGLPPHVITPGGGWAAEPGNLEAIAGIAVTVWLAIDPVIAAERLVGDRSRPLLDGGDRRERLAALADQRTPFYRKASASVDVNGLSAVQAADRLLAVARERAGWA